MFPEKHCPKRSIGHMISSLVNTARKKRLGECSELQLANDFLFGQSPMFTVLLRKNQDDIKLQRQ